MKRIVLGILYLCVILLSLSGGSGLSVESLYRSKQGTAISQKGTTDYKGTEWELLLTSRTIVDEYYVIGFFGGFTKAASYEGNTVALDISSIPAGWFYGASNAIQFPFPDGSVAEFSVGYDSAYLQYNKGESRVDHLRIALRYVQTSYEGLQFSLGLEYSKPLWGRTSTDTAITRFRYNGSAFAFCLGVGYQSW